MPGLPHDFDIRLRMALTGVGDEPARLTGTTERALVGRLAIHLDRVFGDLSDKKTFPDYPRVWDVEYMRAGAQAKAFAPVVPGVGTPRALAPDLIWHRRIGNAAAFPAAVGADANLVAIEVKLRATPSELLTDKAKLRLLVGLEPRIRRFQKDLRCANDPVPGQQDDLGWVTMPAQPVGVTPHYLRGISLNVFETYVDAVEYRHGRNAPVHWTYDF